MVQDQDSDPEVDAETRQRFQEGMAGMLRQMVAGGTAAAGGGAEAKPKSQKTKQTGQR